MQKGKPSSLLVYLKNVIKMTFYESYVWRKRSNSTHPILPSLLNKRDKKHQAQRKHICYRTYGTATQQHFSEINTQEA